MIENIWEKNYTTGRYNKYPFDEVVSFVFNRFGKSPDRSKIRILDLGCGGGNNTKFLCAEGFDTYAVDGSPKSIELTQFNIKDFGDPKKIMLADFRKLPFEDNYFDCVIDRQSIGHNSSTDIDLIISEVHRTLKKDGLYFGMVFSSNHPHCVFADKTGLPGDILHFTNGLFTQSGLVHFFSIPELKDRFHKFKLEDVITRTSKSLNGALESPFNDEYFSVIARKN